MGLVPKAVPILSMAGLFMKFWIGSDKYGGLGQGLGMF
jgi:hypothetical protein